MSEDQKVLFIEWCAADALGGMVQMSPMTELAYRRIIDMIYSTNDELLDDDNVLQYSTKTGPKWKAIKKELIEVHKKIYVADGKIRNDKCTEKLEKSRKNIAQKSTAAKAKHEKDKQLKFKETGSAAAPPSASAAAPADAHANQEPNNQVRKNTHSSATTAQGPAEDPPLCVFSEFWKARPGRGTLAESETDARKEFEKLTAAGADGQQLVTAMTRYAEALRSKQLDGTRYSKAAANFLKDGIWKQYTDGAQAQQKSAGGAGLTDIPDWQKPLLKHIPEQEVRSWFRGATLEDGKLTARSKPAATFIRQRYDIAIGKVFGGNIEVVFNA